jgi:hypothetical protein
MSNPTEKPGNTPPVPNQPIIQTLTTSAGGQVVVECNFPINTQLALYSFPDGGIHLISALAMYDLVFKLTKLYWVFEAKETGTYTVQLQLIQLETTAPTTFPTFSVVVS